MKRRLCHVAIAISGDKKQMMCMWCHSRIERNKAFYLYMLAIFLKKSMDGNTQSPGKKASVCTVALYFWYKMYFLTIWMYHLFLFRKLNKTSIVFYKAYGSIQIKECQGSYTLNGNRPLQKWHKWPSLSSVEALELMVLVTLSGSTAVSYDFGWVSTHLFLCFRK